jgi:hypothetical protein
MNARIGTDVNLASLAGFKKRFLVDIRAIVKLNRTGAVSGEEHDPIAKKDVLTEPNVRMI